MSDVTSPFCASRALLPVQPSGGSGSLSGKARKKKTVRIRSGSEVPPREKKVFYGRCFRGCSATVVHFPGQNWLAGWSTFISLTLRRPIARI